jgi:hypothetical protein
MGYKAELIIPKIENFQNIKLFVYRSTNANDINTISKVSNLIPIIVIDQNYAQDILINNKHCYKVIDAVPENNIQGITYNGPEPNTIPINEYSYNINLISIDSFTYINEMILTPLELSQKNGIVFYYSVIGVNQDSNLMTHLSKVNGTLIHYISDENMTRQLWSCDNYNNDESDQWTLVNTIEYDETDNSIRIGDITKPISFEKYGIPVVETVPKITDVKVSLSSLYSNTFALLSIQNPWQNNNKHFNSRKLKSYKVRYVYNSSYGEFSTPTYQSELPVSIEKMVVMIKSNPVDENDIISMDDSNALKLEMIRRNGLFYNASDHKTLGYNQWTIPLENNKLSVFSETSIQDYINVQISAVPGNLYVLDIYLIDVYYNVSEPCHYILET